MQYKDTKRDLSRGVLHLNNIFKIKRLNSFLLLCCQRCESSMGRPAPFGERTSAAGSTTDRLRVVSKCALIIRCLNLLLIYAIIIIELNSATNRKLKGWLRK